MGNEEEKLQNQTIIFCIKFLIKRFHSIDLPQFTFK